MLKHTEINNINFVFHNFWKFVLYDVNDTRTPKHCDDTAVKNIQPASATSNPYVTLKKRKRSLTIRRNRSHASNPSSLSLSIGVLQIPLLSRGLQFPFVKRRCFAIHRHDLVERALESIRFECCRLIDVRS